MVKNALIEKKTWEGLDILRSQARVDQFWTLLYFITLPLTFRIPDPSGESDEDQKASYGFDSPIGKAQLDLLSAIDMDFDQLPDGLFADLLRWASSFHQELQDEDFPLVFEEVLSIMMKAESQHGSQCATPFAITRFIASLYDSQNAAVYNPFAGMGSFAVHLSSTASYHGEDINKLAKAVANLRLAVHGKGDSFKVSENDSIQNWNPGNKKFDLILTVPPFGMTYQRMDLNDEFRRQWSESVIIEEALNALNPNGKLLMLIPNGFLFRGGREAEFRRKLIAGGLVDTVIAFPDGLLWDTIIPVNLLVIRKAPANSILMVDASSFVHGKGREKVLDDQALLGFLRSHEEHYSKRYVENSKVLEEDSILEVRRYLGQEVYGAGKLLADVLKPTKVTKSKTTVGKLVRILDLKSDPIDFRLVTDTISEAPLPKGVSQVSQSCLLVAARGTNLKPTYFEFSGQPIYLSSDILAFNINVQHIDLGYLLMELAKPYVVEQLNRLRFGMMVPTIRLKDLLSVRIEFPGLEIQRRMVQVAHESQLAELQKTLEGYKQRYGLDYEQQEQNSFLRHSIAVPLKNMRGAFMNLKLILEQYILPNYPELMKQKVDDRSLFDFGHYLMNIENDLKEVTEITLKSASQDGFIKEAELEPVDLIGFVQGYVNELLAQPKEFAVDLLVDELAFQSAEGKPLSAVINGNRHLLKIMLNNLVENAEKHGFNRTKGKMNSLQFKVGLAGPDAICLIVSNSGKPFPPGFNLEMYVRKNSKAGANAGDGLGGWYIHEIMKRHDGTLEVSGKQEPSEYGIVSNIILTFPFLPNE